MRLGNVSQQSGGNPTIRAHARIGLEVCGLENRGTESRREVKKSQRQEKINPCKPGDSILYGYEKNRRGGGGQKKTELTGKKLDSKVLSEWGNKKRFAKESQQGNITGSPGENQGKGDRDVKNLGGRGHQEYKKERTWASNQARRTPECIKKKANQKKAYKRKGPVGGGVEKSLNHVRKSIKL